MLKVRIIPILLWKNFGLVKGQSFNSWRRVGSVLPAVKVYNTRDVDELILLDITATAEGREPDYQSIKDFSAECFVPLTVGGGIKSIDQIRGLLRAGADKVCINTEAYLNPGLINEAANYFGAQCIVVAIDAKRNAAGNYECFSHCGNVATGLDPVLWAKQVEELGAGEIVITSIDHDGMLNGYDLELIKSVSHGVKIPVIAAGGAADYSDFERAIVDANVSAVAAASMYHFTEKTPNEAKKYLHQQGIPVRGYY